MTLPGKQHLLWSADDPQAVAEALRLLRVGRLVALPTDTVYGLCTHGLMPAAIKRIFAAKDRPTEKALPLLLADTPQMEEVAQGVPDLAYELAEEFWPGGLTIVLFRKSNVPDILTGGGPSVALRVPDHPLPRELIKKLGAPLAATSANRSGGQEPLTAQDVNRQIGKSIHLILDGGPAPGGIPSTVVDLTSRPPRVLRQGAVPRQALARLISDLV